VALTYDGGSSDAGVASVLSTLAASGVHATVFLTGDFARRYPAQVRRIADAGHVIGNHSDRPAGRAQRAVRGRRSRRQAQSRYGLVR
jgi:hypothetical protein